jgi:hypothetical protein
MWAVSAPRRPVLQLDSVFWIGQTRTGSGIVYRMVGHTPQRVSTRAMEQMLAKSTDLSQAFDVDLPGGRP